MSETHHYTTECCGRPCPASPRSEAQAFFAQLDGEAKKPHSGEHFRNFVRTLLLRAQEAGIYEPG